MANILIISDDFEPNTRGGAGVIATTLAKGLSKSHTVSAITAVTEETKPYTVDKIKVYPILVSQSKRQRNKTALKDPQKYQQISKLIKKVNPDVINVHNFTNMLCLEAIKAAGNHTKNVYFTAHDAMTVIQGKLNTNSYRKNKAVQLNALDRLFAAKTYFIPNRAQKIAKAFQQNVKKVICVSNELRRALEVNKLHTKFEVIHNGINPIQATNKQIDAFKNKHNINSGPILMFAGRISKPKGFDVAVELTKAVRKEFPGVKLLVCGKQEDQKNDLAVYTGWIDQKQMAAAYGATDVVLVLSNYLDPFPTMNLEAQAHGKLLITTTYGGSPESVDTKSGIILDPTNVQEAAEKLISILKNKAKMNSFKSNAQERYKRLYTVGKDDFQVREGSY